MWFCITGGKYHSWIWNSQGTCIWKNVKAVLFLQISLTTSCNKMPMSFWTICWIVCLNFFRVSWFNFNILVSQSRVNKYDPLAPIMWKSYADSGPWPKLPWSLAYSCYCSNLARQESWPMHLGNSFLFLFLKKKK